MAAAAQHMEQVLGYARWALRLPPRWALMSTAYAALIIAWIFANPVGAAPDEPANLVKAAATGTGQLNGRPIADYEIPTEFNPAQSRFIRGQARVYTLPSRLVPRLPICFRFREDISSACQSRLPVSSHPSSVATVSYVASFPPFAYLPAGLAMRPAADWFQATHLGRLALGLLCALLLGGAAWVLESGGRSSWRRSGLALAVTPMVIFLASELSPSGIETCAALCFSASLISVLRGERGSTRLALLAVSGVALSLSRPLGIAYLAAIAVSTLPLTDFRRLRERGLALASLVILAGLAVGAGWMITHQAPHPLLLSSVTTSLPHVAQVLAPLMGQLVGVFGWLDTNLPMFFYVGWQLPLAAFAGAGFVLGLWRERLAMALAVSCSIMFAAALFGLVLAPAFDLQGRYLLPILVVVPLLSGFVLERWHVLHRSDPVLLGLLVAVLQFVAFWYNSRRYAVGRHGPLFFLGSAQWDPLGGWLPWLALAGLGALLLALAFVPEKALGPRH